MRLKMVQMTLHLQVLFQNDSPATLLARVIGIISPIDQSMLAKGRDTYKYFTKNHMLYERNQVKISRILKFFVPVIPSLNFLQGHLFNFQIFCITF